MSVCPTCEVQAKHTAAIIEPNGKMWVGHYCPSCKARWEEKALDPEAVLAAFAAFGYPRTTVVDFTHWEGATAEGQSRLTGSWRR